MVIDFVFQSGKNWYPQTFLEECKYNIKEKEIKSIITGDLESFSSSFSEEEDFEKYSE